MLWGIFLKLCKGCQGLVSDLTFVHHEGDGIYCIVSYIIIKLGSMTCIMMKLTDLFSWSTNLAH